MTEDEAKTKLCCGPPMVGASVLAHIQGSTQDETFCRCIASACMAWRVNSYGMQPTRVHPDVLSRAWAGWVITDPTPDARGYVGISPPNMGADVYCGLAGAPQ